jgi:adenylate cyclase
MGRALALDPASTDTIGNLGVTYWLAGQFEKSLEYFDKAIRLSPNDPSLSFWYDWKARDYFGLKNYDQAIDWSRRTITINRNRDPAAQLRLSAALAFAGHDAEAHEALRVYLALPGALQTIAALRAVIKAPSVDARPDPRFLDYLDRLYEGLRKAGMPDG